MKRRDFGRNVFLLGAGLPIVSKLSSSASLKGNQFSAEENTETIPVDKKFNYNTQPVFVITKGDKSEVVLFNANFNFQTENIKKNKAGFKTTKIDHIAWAGTGFSKLLNQSIHFRISKIKKASLNSTQLNANFPANLEMSFEYEILDQNKQIIVNDVSANLYSEVKSFKTFFPKMIKVDGNIPFNCNSSNIGFNFCGA